MPGLKFKHGGTVPSGLSVDVTGGSVIVGDYTIALSDFFDAVEYVLKNAYLQGPDDPREKFYRHIRHMYVLKNFVPGKNRLVNDGPPSCP